MSPPLFVMTKDAVPFSSVQTPVAVKAGAGGGVTQADISAVAVKALSFGLDNVYDVELPVTVMVILWPAISWKVAVFTTAPLASLIS